MLVLSFKSLVMACLPNDFPRTHSTPFPPYVVPFGDLFRHLKRQDKRQDSFHSIETYKVSRVETCIDRSQLQLNSIDHSRLALLLLQNMCGIGFRTETFHYTSVLRSLLFALREISLYLIR